MCNESSLPGRRVDALRVQRTTPASAPRRLRESDQPTVFDGVCVRVNELVFERGRNRIDSLCRAVCRCAAVAAGVCCRTAPLLSKVALHLSHSLECALFALWRLR